MIDIEDLRRLSDRWRINASDLRDACHRVYANGFDDCANELDALITKSENERQE